MLTFKLGPSDEIYWTKPDIDEAFKEKDYNKKINDDTMLMHAVKTNDIDLVNKLLSVGADTSIGDTEGRTPLWLCTIFNKPKIAELLIKNGASFEDVKGTNSPLYNAIKHDNNDVAKVLIDLGANINNLNHDNQTPLHCAVFRHNVEMVKYLVSKGAKRDIKNSLKPTQDGISIGDYRPMTPLDIAKEKGYDDLIDILESNGTNSGKKTTKRNNKLLKKNNEEISEKDWNEFYNYLFVDEAYALNTVKEHDITLKKIVNVREMISDENLKTDGDIFKMLNYHKDYCSDSDILNDVFFEDYKDKLAHYNELKDRKSSISNEIHSDNMSLLDSKISKDKELEKIEKYKNESNKGFIGYISSDNSFRTMYICYFLMVVIWTIMIIMTKDSGFNIIKFIVMILCFVSISGGVSTVVEILKKRSIIVGLYLILGVIVKSIILYYLDLIKYGKYIAISQFYIEIPLIILLLIYLEYVKEQNHYVDLYYASKANYKDYEKSYNKKKKAMEETIKANEQESKKIENELEKVSCKIFNKEKYLKKLDAVIIDKCKPYILLSSLIMQRWNDFSDFRSKHYVREIEEKLQEDQIFQKLFRIVNDEGFLNQTKYNSKNSTKAGKYSDYVKYIYNKIDDEDDTL